MPRQKIAHRIDERGGSYRLSNVPAWLDGARYRPARRSDFTVHGSDATVTVRFNHGGGEFGAVGEGFGSAAAALAWITTALASGEWHVRTN